MNRQQVIEYLQTENQVLRKNLGPDPIILNESPKQRLPAAAMELGKDPLWRWGDVQPSDARPLRSVVRRPRMRQGPQDCIVLQKGQSANPIHRTGVEQGEP